MFEKSFAHYLSYGASDQHTARELRASYDGLLVPGTIAAFQREGTGGFVLSLSASEAQTPYLIDPRSPLFQQTLIRPKRAHLLLRKILGLPDDYTPLAGAYDEGLVATVAEHWVAFNCEYKSKMSAKFDKYARRLGELSQETAVGPEVILAPYFVAEGPWDEWWKVSKELFAATKRVAEAQSKTPCFRVVAASSASSLTQLLDELRDEEKLAVWVSGLDEFRTSAVDLATYGKAVRSATNRGQAAFALYGGFFAVLLASQGLRGASHGIGYGEHRDWIELPSSGAAPARYYVPEIHKYLRTELADVLWGAQVTRCECHACAGRPPIVLEYHELMMHSVHCRAREIASWAGKAPNDAESALASETLAFATRLDRAKILEDPFKIETRAHMSHLPVWRAALRELK